MADDLLPSAVSTGGLPGTPRDPRACPDCRALAPRPGTLRGCRAHGCATCDALSDRAGAPVGCARHAPDATAEPDGCPRCAQLAALLGARARCRAHAPPAEAPAPRPTPAPPPAAPRAAPASGGAPGALSDHQLGRLAAALAPLAAMNAAAGARSLFRDLRELVTHGAPPEETPLERGCDSGVIRDARAVWQRWATCSPEVRATLLWVAERSGAVVQAGAWSLALGEAQGPGDARELAVASAEIAESAERAKAKLQQDARGGLTREQAQALDRVTQREARARAALKLATGRLRTWGEAQLCAAISDWFDNRHDPA